MARGQFMWSGYAVVVSPTVPQFHAGDELVPVWPWWRLPYRLLFGRDPMPRRFKAGNPIMEEQAFQMAGKLFVSPKGWEQMRARDAALT
ncbi:MAG TPA: hypothetical protein VHC20_06370 [Candidatus Paceibacterota bacterium]|nr:hypothetical protein [Candidatus Paceibacterota bacterium]